VPVIISTSVIVRDQITGLTFDNHLPWHSDYASVYNATSGQSVSINETLPARHKLTAKNRIPLSRGTDQCSEMRHGYEESTSNRQKYKHEGFVLDVVITPI
ncbi:MAG: hypothetical protein SFX74_10705, partial [Fimbriimonadaceae bacterium]|nr:hypothetical protein [Fimbriimonadaceae bacterium]